MTVFFPGLILDDSKTVEECKIDEKNFLVCIVAKVSGIVILTMSVGLQTTWRGRSIIGNFHMDVYNPTPAKRCRHLATIKICQFGYDLHSNKYKCNICIYLELKYY